jgi:hypothetical protein
MSRVMLSVVALCAVASLTAMPALAADLTPKLPKASEFNDGPNGEGAELGTPERVPTSGEFNNGPEGIAGQALTGSDHDRNGDERAVAPELAGWGDLPGEQVPEGP